MIRRALVTCFVVAAALPAPSQAAPATVLYAAVHDSGVVQRITVSGQRVYSRTVVARDPAAEVLVPTDVRGSVLATAMFGERQHVDLYDTRTKRRLRRIASDASLPQFTPDGKRLVFQLVGEIGDGVALVMTDLSGGNRRVVLPEKGNPVQPDTLSGHAVSRDGRTVHVARTSLDLASVLLAVDLATGTERVVPYVWPHAGRLLHVRVSPDGQTLAVSAAMDDGSSRIGLVPVAGGLVREVPAVGTDSDFVSSFTPDGKGLYLFAYGADGVALAVADVATLAARPLAGSENLLYAIPA